MKLLNEPNGNKIEYSQLRKNKTQGEWSDCGDAWSLQDLIENLEQAIKNGLLPDDFLDEDKHYGLKLILEWGEDTG